MTDNNEPIVIGGHPLPEGMTLDGAMNLLRRKVAASNQRPAGVVGDELAELQAELRSWEDLEKENQLRDAVFGLDLVGKAIGTVRVLEMLSDYWHGDLWRVQCESCGRTAVLRGDDFRPFWEAPSPGYPDGHSTHRVSSCRDFDHYGVTDG